MCDDDRKSREVVVDPEVLERIAGEDAAWRNPEPDADTASGDKADLRAEAVAMLALVIQTRLTQRQREIVQLYFYEGKTQAEIATILGISQQVVSKQLFGVMRKGKKVGGAVGRLRKLLEGSGIRFE